MFFADRFAGDELVLADCAGELLCIDVLCLAGDGFRMDLLGFVVELLLDSTEMWLWITFTGRLCVSASRNSRRLADSSFACAAFTSLALRPIQSTAIWFPSARSFSRLQFSLPIYRISVSRFTSRVVRLALLDRSNLFTDGDTTFFCLISLSFAEMIRSSALISFLVGVFLAGGLTETITGAELTACTGLALGLIRSETSPFDTKMLFCETRSFFLSRSFSWSALKRLSSVK